MWTILILSLLSLAAALPVAGPRRASHWAGREDSALVQIVEPEHVLPTPKRPPGGSEQLDFLQTGSAVDLEGTLADSPSAEASEGEGSGNISNASNLSNLSSPGAESLDGLEEVGDALAKNVTDAVDEDLELEQSQFDLGLELNSSVDSEEPEEIPDVELGLEMNSSVTNQTTSGNGSLAPNDTLAPLLRDGHASPSDIAAYQAVLRVLADEDQHIDAAWRRADALLKEVAQGETEVAQDEKVQATHEKHPNSFVDAEFPEQEFGAQVGGLATTSIQPDEALAKWWVPPEAMKMSELEDEPPDADDEEAVAVTSTTPGAPLMLQQRRLRVTEVGSASQYRLLAMSAGVLAAGLVLAGMLLSQSGDSCAAPELPCVSALTSETPAVCIARQRAEALPASGAQDVTRLLPSSTGYDCAFAKPTSSKCLVRLEARVVGVAPGSGENLVAPLSKKQCVVYSSAVSRPVHEAMRPIAAAFSQGAVDFVVSLLGAERGREVFVEVSGEDVSLFDLCEGRLMQRCEYRDAPSHWQDFVVAHRAPGIDDRNSKGCLGEHPDACLEFQECALCVGAHVTLLGELQRDARGRLSLVPRQSSARRKDRWRTSWEQSGCPKDDAALRALHLRERVDVSDDPTLLSTAPSAPCSRRDLDEKSLDI